MQPEKNSDDCWVLILESLLGFNIKRGGVYFTKCAEWTESNVIIISYCYGLNRVHHDCVKIVLFWSLASLSHQSWLLRQLELQLYQTVLALLVIPLGHSGTQRRLDVDQGKLETKQTVLQISRRSCGRKGKGSGMFVANDKEKNSKLILSFYW